MPPKRARHSRPTQSVSAISGTSTSAVRPRASVASMARRYTSVLPLPVTPKSRPAVNVRVEPATSDFCYGALLIVVEHVRGRREVRFERALIGGDAGRPTPAPCPAAPAARSRIARNPRQLQQLRQRQRPALFREHAFDTRLREFAAADRLIGAG